MRYQEHEEQIVKLADVAAKAATRLAHLTKMGMAEPGPGSRARRATQALVFHAARHALLEALDRAATVEETVEPLPAARYYVVTDRNDPGAEFDTYEEAREYLREVQKHSPDAIIV
jgi:hypothetical protein